MGKPEFSTSEQYLPPKTLAERLKAQAQANGHVEIVEIEAASFMAERFAPDLQTQAANDEEAPSEPMAEPAPVAEPAPQRSSWSSGLVVMAFALVALVPVIAFGALYSRGALSVASLPAWTSCSCLSRSSCSRRSISCVVSRRSPMMWIIALRLSPSFTLEWASRLRSSS